MKRKIRSLRVKKSVVAVLSIVLLLSLGNCEIAASRDTFEKTVLYSHDSVFAIQEDGRIMGWGLNTSGQLGIGTTNQVLSPVPIGDGGVGLYAGEANRYVLKEDGTLWGWGHNQGTLGDGSTSAATRPKKIIEEVRKAFFTDSTAHVILEDGSLWAWGRNFSGSLGDGTSVNRLSPIKVLDGIRDVIIYRNVYYAIGEDDSLWSWGSNANYALGQDLNSQFSETPQKIADNVEKVAIGDTLFVALQTDGTVLTWGVSINETRPKKYMENGRDIAIVLDGAIVLMQDDTLWKSYSATAAPMKIMEEVNRIFATERNGFAIKRDDTLWGWGDNTEGQLGNGTTIGVNAPVQILENVADVYPTQSNVFALTSNRGLWGWGLNSFGEVGNGTDTHVLSPQKILEAVIQFSESNNTSYAIREDKSLWAWGYNYNGQVGDGTTTNRLYPVKVMENVALKGDTIVSTYSVVTPKPLKTALEVVVRQTLGKLSGDLTSDDWLKLTKLDLSGMHLESLGGLEKAKNLEELDLSFANIEDILVIELLPKIRTVSLKNAMYPFEQLKRLRKTKPNVDFKTSVVSINNEDVQKWDIKQEGDDLTDAANAIIEKIATQKLEEKDGFVIDKKTTKQGSERAENIKSQLYAKAILGNKELNRELETVVKFVLQPKVGQTKTNIKIKRDVKELAEVDRLIVEVNPEFSLELTAEQLQDGTASDDMDIEIEEVQDTAYLSEKAISEKNSGGNGKKSKVYKVKIKKSRKKARVGISIKTSDDPYTAIFRKNGNEEEIIGGKFELKSRRLYAKIIDDGMYYVRNNEKNFSDIEGLPLKQKQMIKLLASKGILQGNTTGQFMPNAHIKRSEILTILVRLSYVFDKSATSQFKDVEKGAWYYPYISSGAEIGVVNGYPDNTFKPNNSIGSAELAKMNSMMLVYKKGYRIPKKLEKYLDKLSKNSKIPAWAIAYIAMGEREGFLIKGNNGFYDGTQIMTRQQAAEMLYRLYEKL